MGEPADATDQTHVLLNNCYRDYATRNVRVTRPWAAHATPSNSRRCTPNPPAEGEDGSPSAGRP
ncbi:hypothetical protein C1I93_27165 [Micromonospora endophytica]|uniref:Uncharacterized protein n=1 Tax=Micromonospora endophytica TaxID=515350 RepID=A0A2W2CP40_9ACTN|nr:hypothetical protein C1I93_27165 [Micromonospora endophytica]RIW41749.1 hypothetical protein D3H59_24895 [Micromonospora endophytica]